MTRVQSENEENEQVNYLSVFLSLFINTICYVEAVDSISGLKDSEYKSALINLCEKVINRLK